MHRSLTLRLPRCRVATLCLWLGRPPCLLCQLHVLWCWLHLPSCPLCLQLSLLCLRLCPPCCPCLPSSPLHLLCHPCLRPCPLHLMRAKLPGQSILTLSLLQERARLCSRLSVH